MSTVIIGKIREDNDSNHDAPDTGNFYDQIAWFTEDRGRLALSLKYRRGGFVDFREVALPRRDLTKTALSWRISAHYPLWAEFGLR